MIFRRLRENDTIQLREIHEKFYKEEFPFSDLFGNSLSSFVVTGDSGVIVTFAQIKAIPEIIAITNKDFNVRSRVEALKTLLDASKFCVASRGFDQLHAFVQDSAWEEQLKKNGFKATVGKSLVVNI